MKNRSNRGRKSHRGDRSSADRARRQQQEEALDDALENTFPASDPISIVQPAPPGDELDRVTTSTTRCVDEREAFWAAVYKFRSPAFADAPTFEVRGNNLTICQVCELVKDITDELPYLVAGELVKAMHGDHKLIQLFAPSRTYATGSQCLLELLRERSHGSGAGRPAA
jgi:hypothetical protein